MPFPNQTLFPFTKASIEQLEPDHTGCYGLFKEDKWVYVGRGDIRGRLLDHLGGDNECITAEKPTHFVTVVTDDMIEIEKQLIVELDPECNKKVG